VEDFALAVGVVLEEGLGVLPAGEGADFEGADGAAEIDGDDVVEVGAGSIAEYGALLRLVSRTIVVVL
jgi:hypothetical protein